MKNPLFKYPAVFAGMFVVAFTSQAAAPVIPALVDKPTNSHVPGEFLWTDLFSSNPEKSVEFYAGLFGWTGRTFGTGADVYTVMFDGDQAVGGVVRGPQAPEGERGARWVSYVSVASVEQAVARATGKGGRVVLPTVDIPNRGIHSIVQDPEGALFGFLKTTTGDPEDYLPEVNRWVWISVFSKDTSAMVEFYKEVIGYDVVANLRTDIDGDFVLTSNGHARAGVYPLQGDSEYKPEWVAFVRVADVEATAAAAEKLGATVFEEVDDSARGNQLRFLVDPSGAIFGIAEISAETEEELK